MIEIGKANLYNMDCMDLMAQYPDNYFELAIVDPPYGIGMDKGSGCKESIDKRDGKKIIRKQYNGNWDNEIPSKQYFSELNRVSKNQIIWGGNYFAHILKMATHWIFWDKQNPMPTFGDGELAWTSFTKKSVTRKLLPYWGHQNAGELTRIHPTQKPVKLYEWLIANYAKPNDKILDTHLGSMSSVIACLNMGFEIVGSELDADYFNAGVDRVRQSQRQERLF